MRASQAKRLIASGLAASAALALTAAILTLGLVVFSAGSGADPADAFSEIPVLPENYEEIVRWHSDAEDLVRGVEPDTRTLLESTLVRSWQSVDAAQRTGQRDGTAVWFVPGLVDQVARSSSTSTPASVRQHAHAVEVTFYSLDGSVLSANVTSDLERSSLNGPTLRSDEQFEIVFILSDGNWRIQHLHRLSRGAINDKR